jgi:hypothetical protein
VIAFLTGIRTMRPIALELMFTDFFGLISPVDATDCVRSAAPPPQPRRQQHLYCCNVSVQAPEAAPPSNRTPGSLLSFWSSFFQYD